MWCNLSLPNNPKIVSVFGMTSLAILLMRSSRHGEGEIDFLLKKRGGATLECHHTKVLAIELRLASHRS